MNEKIVHLTTVHPVDDPRIYYRECKSLADSGHEIILLAPGENNYYKDNIRILAIGGAENRFYRLTIFQFKALAKALQQKGSIYHFHDPELIFLGIALKILGKKVVYDVHEDVPQDILLKQYLPVYIRKILAKVASLCEKTGAYFFDAIVTVTPTIAKKFPPEKVFLVRNFPSINQNNFDYISYQQRKNELIYIGSISETRGLKEMVQAVNATHTGASATLTLIGNIAPSLYEQYVKTNSETVKHIPRKPYTEIEKFLNHGKIGLVILHPINTFLKSYPLKLFEYMAAGLPVIASNFPEWELMIKKYECGITVDPKNMTEITEAITYLLKNPKEAYRLGQNGKKAIESELNWECESKTLLNMYRNLY